MPDIKFHQNRSCGGKIVLSGQKHDKTGLVLAFHNLLKKSSTTSLRHAGDIGFD